MRAIRWQVFQGDGWKCVFCGRAARLLEKWFLTTKLGHKFWNIQPEKHYKDNRPQYYANINLGVNYYELNYDKAMPFLLMLPSSIKI